MLIQNKKLEAIAWQQAHEVRRPVANILGLCSLIKENSNDSDAEKQQYVDYLYQATQELDAIIYKIVEKTERL